MESPSRQRPICRAEGVARASARLPGHARSVAPLPSFFLPLLAQRPSLLRREASRPPAGRRLEVPRPSCRASYWSRLSTFHAGFKNGPGQPGREERKGSAGWPWPAERRRQLFLLAEPHTTGPFGAERGGAVTDFWSDFGAAGMEPFF